MKATRRVYATALGFLTIYYFKSLCKYQWVCWYQMNMDFLGNEWNREHLMLFTQTVLMRLLQDHPLLSAKSRSHWSLSHTWKHRCRTAYNMHSNEDYCSWIKYWRHQMTDSSQRLKLAGKIGLICAELNNHRINHVMKKNLFLFFVWKEKSYFA